MKPLVPMIASLALCGAGIAALLASTANADTPRRPMMVAMLTPQFQLSRASNAAPPAEGGAPARRQPDAADLAARHKQMCQDAYAHQVGELAYLEVRLNLTPPQQPLFDRWKSAKLDIAKRGEADCSTRELPARNPAARPTPLESMAREEDLLKRHLADLEAEQPPLTALYNSLTTDQKETLAHPQDSPPRLSARRMFAQMGPRPGLMRPNLLRQGGPGSQAMRPGPRPPAPPAPQ